MDKQDIETILDEFQRMRGWIVNSFAQVEYILADLVVRCRQFPEYQSLTGEFPYRVETRIAVVRKILKLDGPLSQDRVPLDTQLTEFESMIDLRNLIVHGLATFVHDANRDWAMVFQLWRPHRNNAFTTTSETFSPDALKSIVEYSQEFAAATLEVIRTIHRRHGWGN